MHTVCTEDWQADLTLIAVLTKQLLRLVKLINIIAHDIILLECSTSFVTAWRFNTCSSDLLLVLVLV